MKTELFDPAAPERPVKLSINSDLLRKARDLNVNLSHTLEDALIEVLRQKTREAWLLENREALNAYNAHIERDGVFSDGLRSF